MKKHLTLLLTLIMVFALSAAIISCTPTARITDLTIDKSAVTTEVKVGDDIDVSGLTANVSFSDNTSKTITADDLNFYFDNKKLVGTVFNDLTETAGTLEIVVDYLGAQRTIIITVSEVEPEVYVPDYRALSFETPADETERASVAKETSDEDEGKFYAVQETVRLVGDDNAFIYLPTLTIIDANVNGNNEIKELTEYETKSEIYFIDEANADALVKLDAVDNETTKTTEYKYGDTLIATSYYAIGKYEFTPYAIDNKYQIEVIARDYPQKSHSLDIKVVDGFNIYDPKELSVIDNVNSEWNDIKNELKLGSLNPNAVVLQCDIVVTDNDLPKTYVATIDREFDYYEFRSDGQYKDENAKKIEATNKKRLTRETEYGGQMYIYERSTPNDFKIYGNFYTLDVSGIPLVSAYTEMPVEDYVDKIGGYGSDFSNASLFRIKNTITDSVVSFDISNLNVIGNSGMEQYVMFGPDDPTLDKEPLPVNAGGLIFLKPSTNCNMTLSNVISKKFFIGFLSEYEKCELNADKVKMYDSYQNAGFVWDSSTLTITNSSIKRAGGPLFIMQYLRDEPDHPYEGIPNMIVENSVLESYVTGKELWFKSMSATSLLSQVRAIVNRFALIHGKTIRMPSGENKDKINIICLLMPKGTSANDLTNPTTKGYFKLNSGDEVYTIDRLRETPISSYNYEILKLSFPTLSVGDDEICVAVPSDPDDLESAPISYKYCDASSDLLTSVRQYFVCRQQGWDFFNLSAEQRTVVEYAAEANKNDLNDYYYSLFISDEDYNKLDEEQQKEYDEMIKGLEQLKQYQIAYKFEDESKDSAAYSNANYITFCQTGMGLMFEMFDAPQA